jgi:hypothetical protein
MQTNTGETYIFPTQHGATFAAGNISDCMFPGCHVPIARLAFNYIDAEKRKRKVPAKQKESQGEL